jgi:hypothetical protein
MIGASMRDDLLDAKASVDWAFAQLPSLHQRIESWLSDNIEITIEDAEAPPEHQRVIALAKAELPRAFNVEVGAYLNAIRSSLDLLATAIAYRYPGRIAKPEKAYFPVVASAAEFARSRYKAHEFVEGLPDRERGIIEAQQPYHRRNEALGALHDLDIMRKHRRLIQINPRPAGYAKVSGAFRDFRPTHSDWTLRANEKTVLGFLRRDRPSDGEIKFLPHVSFSETGFAARKPIGAVLAEFASRADSIIRLFDTP